MRPLDPYAETSLRDLRRRLVIPRRTRLWWLIRGGAR